MATSTLTTKGQITIPKAVRDRLGLQPGDELDFRFNDEGRLVLYPRQGSVLERISGLLADYAPATPVTVEEMNEIVRRRAVEKYGRPEK